MSSCLSLSKSEIEEKISEYEGIIIRSRFEIDSQFIDKAINLKFIARAGSGLENIDVSYIKSKKIKCFNVRRATDKLLQNMLLE